MTAPQAVPSAADGRSTASQSLLPPSLVFADTPSRIVANMLDSFAVGALAAIPLSLLGFFDYRFSALDLPDRSSFFWGSLLSYALQVAYFVWFWTGGRRATPGQKVFSIQVGRAFDGEPLSIRQAVIRFLGMGTWLFVPTLLPFRALAIVFGCLYGVWTLVVLGSVVTSPTKQGIHDRLAGSALVRPAGADRTWAVRVIWLFVVLAVLEIVLLASVFFVLPREPQLQDFYARYLDWLWPS